jgi:hypothetical protein
MAIDQFDVSQLDLLGFSISFYNCFLIDHKAALAQGQKIDQEAWNQSKAEDGKWKQNETKRESECDNREDYEEKKHQDHHYIENQDKIGNRLRILDE